MQKLKHYQKFFFQFVPVKVGEKFNPNTTQIHSATPILRLIGHLVKFAKNLIS